MIARSSLNRLLVRSNGRWTLTKVAPLYIPLSGMYSSADEAPILSTTGNQEDEYNEDVEIEARLSGFIEEEEGSFIPSLLLFLLFLLLALHKANRSIDDAVLYGRMERNGETHGRARSESPLTPPPSSPPRGTRQAKTNAREKLSLNTNDSDDESDLTDLEEDDDLGDIELKDSSSAPPTKLKAKAKGGSKPDKKTKTKKKSKGKGKAKAKAKTSRQAYSDSEDDAQPKPKVKKQILAKATRWNDIPDWGDSDRCQLLEMPTEILDLMFAIRPELKVSRICRFVLVICLVLTKYRLKTMSRWLGRANSSDIIWTSLSSRRCHSSGNRISSCIRYPSAPTRISLPESDLSPETSQTGGSLVLSRPLRKLPCLVQVGSVERRQKCKSNPHTTHREAKDQLGPKHNTPSTRRKNLTFEKKSGRIGSQSSN